MTNFRHYPARAMLLLLAAAALSACGSFDLNRDVFNTFTPYKLEILQGNFVSKEQVAALKKGMNPQQVRELLGTPLVVSVFHADRWDYVFTFKSIGAETQSRKLVVFFSNGVLERFEGDEMPSETEFVAKLDSGRSLGKAPSLEATPEALAKFSRAQSSVPALPSSSVTFVVNPAAVPTNYPPLEAPGAPAAAPGNGR